MSIDSETSVAMRTVTPELREAVARFEAARRAFEWCQMRNIADKTPEEREEMALEYHGAEIELWKAGVELAALKHVLAGAGEFNLNFGRVYETVLGALNWPSRAPYIDVSKTS
jgi:hypothetical protein